MSVKKVCGKCKGTGKIKKFDLLDREDFDICKCRIKELMKVGKKKRK